VYCSRRVRTLVGRMRVRGYGLLPSLLLVLPRVTLVRAYDTSHAASTERCSTLRIGNGSVASRMHATPVVTRST
jgi:hypothetical protein